MSVRMVNDQGLLSVWETELLRDREAGEWVHYSEDGTVCLKCWKIGPFVWIDSEYKWEDHHHRCELRSNQHVDPENLT